MVVKLAVGDRIEEVEVPTKCPRCGKHVDVTVYGLGNQIENYSFRCSGNCGGLYYDRWLGIWRIKPTTEE